MQLIVNLEKICSSPVSRRISTPSCMPMQKKINLFSQRWAQQQKVQRRLNSHLYLLWGGLGCGSEHIYAKKSE